MKAGETSPSTKTAESIDDLVDRCEAARVLGISIRTLDRWNRLGYGPPRIRYGAQIRYRITSLVRWVLSHEAVPQSPVPADGSLATRSVPARRASRFAPAHKPESTQDTNADGVEHA